MCLCSVVHRALHTCTWEKNTLTDLVYVDDVTESALRLQTFAAAMPAYGMTATLFCVDTVVGGQRARGAAGCAVQRTFSTAKACREGA